jgi:urease accessory protein
MNGPLLAINVPAREPNLLSHEPNALSHEPNVLSHEPNVLSHEPNALSHEPNVLSHEPNALSHEPNVLSHEPNVLSHEPNVLSHEPNVLSHEPNALPREPNVPPHETNVLPHEPNVPPHEDGSGARGWHARLELQFQDLGARTRLTRRRHVGPLLVQKPLYPERHMAGNRIGQSDPCHVCLIHPPGGVASGDELDLQVELQPGSHALLTTPAAGKYYRRGVAGLARMTQTFDVHSAVLEWLPQESIFYPDAAVQLRSIVKLSGSACFLGWEIGCLGLPASGLTLGAGELRLGFELWQDGRPLLLERLALAHSSLAARWGMAGFTALGTALFYPASRRELDLANVVATASTRGMTLACTLVDGILVCRAVAQRTDHLKQAFVCLWRELRPALIGREPVTPRIWAT